MRRIPLIHLFVLLAACEASAADPSVTFTVLPGFGEIDPQGQHLGSLSGNGVVVVGFGSSRNQGVRGEAPFRWTRRDGITSLQPEVRDFQSGLATGVSYDGDVIVGTVTLDQYGNVPFVWTEVDGFRYLDFTGEFYDISDEGTAVGKWTPDGESVARPFLWTEESGLVDLWEDFKEYGKIWIEGISGNGKVVFGVVARSSSSALNEGFRWTEELGLVLLGDLPGGVDDSYILDASYDGSILVGRGTDELGKRRPSVWTEETGLIRIQPQQGLEIEGAATGVSSDGSVIVGRYPTGEDAWIWDAENGFRSFRDLLKEPGTVGPLDEWEELVSGIELLISSDGTKIAGTGVREFDEKGGYLWEVYLIDLAPQAPPQITTSPIAATVGTTGLTTLTVEATGEDLNYQWQLDGVDVSGATEATYIIPSAQRYHAGDYTVVVSNGGGSVTSDVATLTVDPPPDSDARLTNLSTRALALTGNNVLIPGFVISGAGTKSLLIRAVGASLRQDPFNLPTALEDPKMTLKRWTGSAFEIVTSNDDWETNANAAEIAQATLDLGAFALTDSRDAALYADLQAGRYTVVAGGVGDLTGVAIVELYDADGGSGTTVLTNISNRGFVGTGASVMIPGISVSSEGPKTFLIRAVGPALGVDPFNLTGVLEDPILTVFSGKDAILWNDNWGDNPDATYTAQISSLLGAFGLPEGSKDAAFVVTLPPGNYTIKAAGVGGVTGTAIVEVYVVE